MKQYVQLRIIATLLLISGTAFSFNPVQGFYGGLFGTVSRGPSNEQVVFLESGLLFTGKVGYDVVGGGGGVVLGYKLSQFRLEGEAFYNRVSTGPLRVGSCILQSPNVITPTGFCPQGAFDDFATRALAYSGSSNVLYGLVNAYFDIILDSENPVVPYVGLGIGQARIKNSSNFINTNRNLTIPASHGESVRATAGAMQGILGVSYLMDDLTWIGMDFRHTTTQNVVALGNKNYPLNSINFNVNFAFDKGGISID